jgi:hypothetical protein
MKYQKTTIRAAATAVVMAGLLAACGGGDDDNGPTSGGWIGTTSTNRDLTAVVLPDGNYYLMYSKVGDAAIVGGVVQGTGSLDAENFSSADGLDFSAEGAGVKPASVAAVLQGGGSFTGTVAQATGTAVTFQSNYDRRTSIVPDTATLAKLTGAYVGNAGFALGVRPATFTVASDGGVTSTINGCSITGKATPRTDVNVYDLTIAFGGAPCAIPNLSFTGIAYLRQDNGRLYAAARNATYKTSVIFSGSKP